MPRGAPVAGSVSQKASCQWASTHNRTSFASGQRFQAPIARTWRPGRSSAIALSQLNRAPEQRADKRPHIYDLRDSGSLEDDADLVLLLHRDDAYAPDNRPGEADLIVAKHRNGPTAIITIAFHPTISAFTDPGDRGFVPHQAEDDVRPANETISTGTDTAL